MTCHGVASHGDRVDLNLEFGMPLKNVLVRWSSFEIDVYMIQRRLLELLKSLWIMYGNGV